MTTKHTPGPWNIYFNSQDDRVIRKMFEDGTESHVIARCRSGLENALLIAAAPDLLEALRCAVNDADAWGLADDECDWLSIARAAIAKATGEQP